MSSTAAVDRAALHAWVDARLDKVEGTPIPEEMSALAEGERLNGDEVQALWLAAGIASQIGMALTMTPGTFVLGFPDQYEDDGEAAEGSSPDA